MTRAVYVILEHNSFPFACITARPVAMTEQLRVYVLGEFRLYRDGVLISPTDWHTSQARQLFKLLLTERGHMVSARKLTDLLWPEYVEHAHKTLRSAISTLRTVLEPDREAHTASRFLPRGRAGYRLLLPVDCTIWVDAFEFEQLLAHASGEHDPSVKRQLLTEALSLYSDDYLIEDEEERWVLAERKRLHDSYLKAATALMELLIEAMLYDEAIEVGGSALVIDMYHEPLYRKVMQCQASMGNTTGALQTFEQCRRLFAQELGADPSPQTLALHVALLRGDFQGKGGAGHQQGHTPHRAVHSPLVQSSGALLATAQKQSALEVRLRTGFVGRQAELAWLDEHLRFLRKRSPTPVTHIIAVIGEAGVGKTSLLEHLLRGVPKESIGELTTTCHAPEQGVAFAPLLSMLRAWVRDADEEELNELPDITVAQVCAVLPELAAKRRAAGSVLALATKHPEYSYQLLLAGLVDLFHFMSRSHPLILALDDLQWADESTLLVLHRLLQTEFSTRSSQEYSQGFPLLLIICYRPEDASENVPLTAMLRSVGRGHVIDTLELANFSQEEVEAYLHLYQATPPPSLSLETLYRATKGNALFLTEAVRTLQEQQELLDRGNGYETILHALLHSLHIRDIILARLARLPQPALALLEIMSLLERPFPLALLRPEPTKDDLEACDLLIKRHFLVEVSSPLEDEPHLNFSHDVLRAIVQTTFSRTKHRQMHHQMADLLVHYAATNRERYAAEIAEHYQQGGKNPMQALYYRVIAGDHARYTFSYKQAVMHYDTAVELLQTLASSPCAPQSLDREEWMRKIHHGRMLACEALLDWQGIQESHRHLHDAVAGCETLIPADDSSYRLAMVRSLMGYLPEGAKLGRDVVERLQTDMQFLQQLSPKNKVWVDVLLDMVRRWVDLIVSGRLVEPCVSGGDDAQSSAQFPAFFPAPRPPIHNWHDVVELFGPAQAAFMLFEYGWILYLQGLLGDAEQCLLVALEAADETHQDMYWIHASMLLSNIYLAYGRQEEGAGWRQRCMDRCEQLSEAKWVSLWPLMNQVYYSLDPQYSETAERLLLRLEGQLAQLSGFDAHRYAHRIATGLLALVRGELEQAKEALQAVLQQQEGLYIETYVLTEKGLADIARLQGQYDEAYERYWKMLVFCGERSLLVHYGSIALSMAQLQIERRQLEGVALLLEALNRFLAPAGHIELYQSSTALLAQLHGSVSYLFR